MDKTIEYYGRELKGVRTGRATTALIEYVKVDYYGSSTDLRDIAAVSVGDATQLVVKPYDPGSKNEIIKQCFDDVLMMSAVRVNNLCDWRSPC